MHTLSKKSGVKYSIMRFAQNLLMQEKSQRLANKTKSLAIIAFPALPLRYLFLHFILEIELSVDH